MTSPAKRSADELYEISWDRRAELALCVTSYLIRADGTVVVRKFGPTVPMKSDSVTITTAGVPLCPEEQPVLHTHLIENGWRYTPSPVDSGRARILSAPFQLLMSDRHSFKVLWKPADTTGKKR